MNALKALGVVGFVFLIWCVAAFYVMYQQHIGQVYDASAGMWFLDQSPLGQDKATRWTGSAIMWGTFVALGAGLIYFFRKGLIRFSK